MSYCCVMKQKYVKLLLGGQSFLNAVPTLSTSLSCNARIGGCCLLVWTFVTWRPC